MVPLRLPVTLTDAGATVIPLSVFGGPEAVIAGGSTDTAVTAKPTFGRPRIETTTGSVFKPPTALMGIVTVTIDGSTVRAVDDDTGVPWLFSGCGLVDVMIVEAAPFRVCVTPTSFTWLTSDFAPETVTTFGLVWAGSE